MSFSDSIIMGSEGSKIIKKHKQRILSIPSNVNLLSKYDELDGEQGIQVALANYDEAGNAVAVSDYYPLVNNPVLNPATGSVSTTYVVSVPTTYIFLLKIPPLLIGNDSSNIGNYIFPEAVLCTAQYGQYSQKVDNYSGEAFIKKNLYSFNSLSLDPWIAQCGVIPSLLNSSNVKFEVRVTLFTQNFNMAYTLEHRFYMMPVTEED